MLRGDVLMRRQCLSSQSNYNRGGNESLYISKFEVDVDVFIWEGVSI